MVGPPGAAAAAAAAAAAVNAHDDDIGEDEVAVNGPLGLYSNCPNACCTGAFIQEAMCGIVMSADLHELIFTNETVRVATHRPYQGHLCLQFLSDLEGCGTEQLRNRAVNNVV